MRIDTRTKPVNTENRIGPLLAHGGSSGASYQLVLRAGFSVTMKTPKKALRLPLAYTCEVRVQTLRELAPVRLCDTADKCVRFFREHVQTAPWFNDDKECAVALHLNTRRQIVSFELLGLGTKSSVLVHVGEAFRAAIAANAAAMVLVHNHPSGNHSPSEADISIARDLFRAGIILGVQLLDSIIIGHQGTDPGVRDFFSLYECGYFSNSVPPA